jgi:hypothetical protein
MGIEAPGATVQATINQAAASPLDQLRVVDATIAVNVENFVAGHEKLAAAGLDADRWAKLVVGGGGACIGGTVAELMVLEEHADMAADIVKTAEQAVVEGRDPDEAVFTGLRMVLLKDRETKALKEVDVDLAEVLKKNTPE